MAHNVAAYARRYGIPIRLARALIGQESGGRTDAVSSAGATGLTQVLPSTAAGMYHISVGEAARRLKNPQFALDAGFRYLAAQYKEFKSWRLALAAYNAGPNAVRKYGGVPPYRQTEDYVRNILGKAGAGSSSGRTPGADPGNLGSIPSPAAPDLQGAALEGLQALASGHYSPQEGLAAVQRATAKAQNAPGGVGAPPMSGSGPAAPPAGAPGDWKKYVTLASGADRAGVHTQEAVLQFVGRLGKLAGSRLTIGTGTNHSRLTVNGNVSNHWNGMAADIPATGARLRRLGFWALVEAGMSRKDALKASKQGGLFNVGPYQIIFATHIGGDHTNHIHIGIRG